MTLRTITVPNPSPGQDWVTVVPGKYLYNVTGIIATLTTDPGVVAADASGHGNTGGYVFDAPGFAVLMLGQGGAIPGDAAVHLSDLGGATGYGTVEQLSFTAMDFSGDFSIEWWSQITATAAETGIFFWDDAGVDLHQVTFNSAGNLFLELNGTHVYRSVNGAFVLDGAWHHYVWSYTAASPLTTALYRDGAVVALAARPAANIAIPASATLARWGGSPTGTPGGLDEVAVYPVALSAARVAAHFAAAGDFGAYSAAVLADAPAIYHHLDDAGGPGGRQPTLLITDGSITVEHVPSGFPTAALGTDFVYSWQPNLQAATESLGGTLVTVPLPELHLPAGYTVGTETFGLAAGDQWSAITLWWDDAYQTAQQAADSYLYAPGAHLVYQQVKGGVS